MTDINTITYRCNWELTNYADRPANPLRVVFLTSIRDTGACDRNGVCVETPEGPKYMEGVVEHAVRQTHDGGFLRGIIDVVGVITDDVPDGETLDYPTLPMDGQPWIHPLDLWNPDGTPIRNLTVNIMSSFRKLPLADKLRRAEEKFRFEKAVLAHMHRLNADVLISDHYMAEIKYLVDEFGLFGRVLNIHPAITLQDHPFWFPGKTPTADAIEKARTGAEVYTGATLHLMDTIIDHGPALAYQCGTLVLATDQSMHLRARNYPAKCRVFTQGMIHYTHHIFPYIHKMNPREFGNRVKIGTKW